MIIEDDRDILDLLEIIFTDIGYAVIKINRAIIVKEIIEIAPHLIIIDFLLPFRLGNELCLELKSTPETRHIPIIIYSAANDYKEISEKSCADAYIDKPFDLDDLINHVNTLVL